MKIWIGILPEFVFIMKDAYFLFPIMNKHFIVIWRKNSHLLSFYLQM